LACSWSTFRILGTVDFAIVEIGVGFAARSGFVSIVRAGTDITTGFFFGDAIKVGLMSRAIMMTY
jgi:hypothetical protein